MQEENDELYEMLKSGETGKLKEEVRGLRRVVDRLQGALKGTNICIAYRLRSLNVIFVKLESQQIIIAMSYVVVYFVHN